MGSLRVENPAVSLHPVLDALQHRHITGRGAVIIPDESAAAVCIWPDDADGPFCLQGEKPVVLQQNTGLQCGLMGELQVRVTLHGGIGDRIVFRFFPIHDAQKVAGGEQMHRRFGDVFLRDELLIISAHQALVGVSAVEITAHFQGEGGGFRRGVGDMMAGVKVPDGPAVGDHVPLKLPLSAERVAEKKLTAAAGFPVGAVVGAHDGLNLGLLYQVFKGGKIGLLKIFWRGNGVELMAERFRPAVHGKVLGTGGAFQILSMPLQTAHISLSHTGCQIGVFSVGLMTAAPAGIPEDVDVG